MHNSKQSTSTRGFHSLVQSNSACSICKDNHNIYNCKEFIDLSPKDRYDKIKELKACTNCLKKGHFYKSGRDNRFCTKCSAKHYTLLHQNRVQSGSEIQGRNSNTVNEQNISQNEHVPKNETK